MLVLSRKVGETIEIDGDIVISIVRIGPNTVKIGIDAPKTTGIRRTELPDKADDQQEGNS
jgi:carbon storage regulator